MDMLQDMQEYVKSVKRNLIKRAQLQNRNWCKYNSNNEDINGMMAISENGSIVAYIKDEKNNQKIAMATTQSGKVVVLTDDGTRKTKFNKRKKRCNWRFAECLQQ